MAEISLNPVDRLEILSIMDNSLDVLMSSTPIAKRAPRKKHHRCQRNLRGYRRLSSHWPYL